MPEKPRRALYAPKAEASRSRFWRSAGLVGPAWALREQAAPLLNGLGHQPAAVSTDASPPSDH